MHKLKQSPKVRGQQAVKVGIVNLLLPHYRRDVYHYLEKDPDLDVIFLSGQEDYRGIRALPLTDFASTVQLRTKARFGVFWQVGLIKYLVTTDLDCVVFLGDPHFLTTWIAAAFCRLKRVRVLFWTIGWHRPETGIKRILRLAFYRLAHGLLVYGETNKELGIRHGYPAARMHVVFNSSSQGDPVYESADERLAQGLIRQVPSTPRITVGAVARLNIEKRFDLLIKSVSTLRTQGLDLGVLLVGEGPARASLRELADNLQVPLLMPGAIYSEAGLTVVYSKMRITVIPSLAGLTTIQSLRFGVPVVTHDNASEQVPEFEAVIPGVTGALYEYGNSASLAENIRYWARSKSDYAEVARTCREEVERRWTPAAHARRIADAIMETCGRIKN